MPMHSTSCVVSGFAALDVCWHFIHRWNLARYGHNEGGDDRRGEVMTAEGNLNPQDWQRGTSTLRTGPFERPASLPVRLSWSVVNSAGVGSPNSEKTIRRPSAVTPCRYRGSREHKVPALCPLGMSALDLGPPRRSPSMAKAEESQQSLDLQSSASTRRVIGRLVFGADSSVAETPSAMEGARGHGPTHGQASQGMATSSKVRAPGGRPTWGVVRVGCHVRVWTVRKSKE